jgi:uncharacterized cupin superfamily protein
MGKVHLDAIDWDRIEHGETTVKRKQLGKNAGGEQLGCSCFELSPGSQSWPYHYLDSARESRPSREGRAFRRSVGTED